MKILGKLFKDYKRNSLEAMAKAVHTDYQKFQYFFSGSQWNLPAMNRKRLEIIQRQKTTASTQDGLLAIGDKNPMRKRHGGKVAILRST